jgi:hypothetical protein
MDFIEDVLSDVSVQSGLQPTFATSRMGKMMSKDERDTYKLLVEALKEMRDVACKYECWMRCNCAYRACWRCRVTRELDAALLKCSDALTEAEKGK